MDITPLLRPEQKTIQSYSDGAFRISGEIYRHPVLVTDEVVTHWTSSEAPLMPSEEIRLLQGKIDILLIGAGRTHTILPPSQRVIWQGLGFTVDIMDTMAACRTYNILTAEGRRVAAALIPV